MDWAKNDYDIVPLMIDSELLTRDPGWDMRSQTHATIMDRARTHLHTPGMEGPVERFDEAIALAIAAESSGNETDENDEIASGSKATTRAYRTKGKKIENRVGRIPTQQASMDELLYPHPDENLFPVYNSEDYYRDDVSDRSVD
jgi:hypothetical protein